MFDRIMRLMRHRWMDESSQLVDRDMLERLRKKVRSSETAHSGEIRICIEAALPNSYLMRPASIKDITRQRALSQFGKLRVWDTEHNNGVLVYLLLAERQIELVADRGLNNRVPAAVWQDMVQRLGAALQEGRFEDGLGQAIDEVSAFLQRYFPLDEGMAHRNELPDIPALS